MANKKAPKKAAKKSADTPKENYGSPVFPYTTEPQALKRLLAEIPKRPKPPKMTLSTLKSWGVSSSNNAGSVVRVMKKIGFLQEGGEPTEHYIEYMKPGVGPLALGQKVRETYRVLFENSLAPQSDSNEKLKSLFHIHTGGGEDAMRLQIQTFKALSEYARFGDAPAKLGQPDADKGRVDQGSSAANTGGNRLPPVQVDLHIHLPDNKSTREYEAIIQDIAKYIYGRDIERA